MTRGRIAFLASFTLFLSAGSLSGGHGGPWMPTEKHYSAARQGQDCSIYRQLAKRAGSELEENKKLLDAQAVLLRERRESLERCARSHGAERFADLRDEGLAAELCPENYDAWLAPSYRVHMLRQDIDEKTETLSQLRLLLRHYCKEIPTPTILPAAIPERF